jgi:hypothetical protein
MSNETSRIAAIKQVLRPYIRNWAEAGKSKQDIRGHLILLVDSTIKEELAEDNIWDEVKEHYEAELND